MAYLHHFTVTVLLVSFLCFFCESLSCVGPLKQYTSLVTGLVISLSVLCAFLQIRDVDLQEFTVDETAYAVSAENTLAMAYARQLETKIEARVAEDLDIVADADVCVRADGDALAIESVVLQASTLERERLVSYMETQFGIVAEVR